MTGNSSPELFDGMGGNDTISGGGGGDTFIFNAGYGQLEISEFEFYGATDVLLLGAGIDESSLSVTINGSGGYTLTDGIAGDRILLDYQSYGSYYGVQKVQFADGTTLSAAQLQQMAENTPATTGDDTLVRGSGADLIDGLGGNDVVSGGGGGDTFVFNPGYGHLEIIEAETGTATNVLRLGAGISESDVKVSENASFGLVLADGVTGDQITLDYAVALPAYGVQQVQFADGTTWTSAQLLQMAMTGTSGADTLYGSTGNDLIDGKGGTDTVYGDAGSDIYVLDPGYGALTVVNGMQGYSTTPAGDLSIADTNPENIWLQQVGNDLRVDIMGSATEATIQGWFSNSINQLSALTVNNGSAGALMLDNAQVSHLVQAMATFSSANPSFDPTSVSNPLITDPTVLAVVNGSWHA
jgi:Ca2+-binding RTX toxin-like protein